jgi:hypothetical protein
VEICDIISEFRKRGIPFKMVTIEFNPKIEKEVFDYVMRIERAHKRAATGKSKLIFKAQSPILSDRAFVYPLAQNFGGGV